MSLPRRLRLPLPPSYRTKLGLRLIKDGRAAQGFRHLALAARRGWREAQYRTGMCYLQGVGAPRSVGEAMRWFERAAQAGCRDSQFQLAVVYLREQQSNHRSSDVATGGFAFKEQAGTSNPDLAFAWARKAAQADLPEAQALLGSLLQSGPARDRHADEAEQWYAKSAAAGCPQGSLGLGLALARRARSDDDWRRVANEIEKATKANLPNAQYVMGSLLELGLGVTKDVARATALYRRAAVAGLPAAQARLGVALLDQRRVGAHIEAETWLRRAGEQGVVDAWVVLGQQMLNGHLGERDPEQAAVLFQRAPEQGHPGAMYALGALYNGGHDIVADPAASLRWLQRAAELGHSKARASLTPA